MKEGGWGRGYKYNPEYRGGRVKQSYLPEGMEGRVFLEEGDLGDRVDSELGDSDMEDGEGRDGVEDGGD